MGAIGFNSNSQLQVNGSARTFGSYTAYSLISGNLALSSSVTDTGFGTTLYTGNGSTQSVVTGVDMSTQWGNDASETFGGLVWLKSRSLAAGNVLLDTIRGVGNFVSTNSTVAQASSSYITSFNSNGITIGTTGQESNISAATYASWNFQTTHRVSGTTNHGKAYTCHYNPFTGFTIVKYEGSGLAGHEIPHHLGRKLGFVTAKNLSAIANWTSTHTTTGRMFMNDTSALNTSLIPITDFNESSTVLSNTGAEINTSTNQYILYGWANSYFDEANTLIGNYEIGIYQGTGAAGNKVTTRGKPAWVIIKRLDSTGDWMINDNQRMSTKGALYANNSTTEDTSTTLILQSDGFTHNINYTNGNASGGQYLYMVVYDNDAGSGKSKYPRATDTSTLNLNAIVPFANGVDANGTKNTILTKNETVSGLTLTQGKNYVYAKNDGTYGVKAVAPQYGSYNGFGDYFDVNSNKWYNSPSVFSDLCNGTTNFTADEVTGGAVATLSSVEGELKVLNNGATYGGATFLFSVVSGKKYRIVFSLKSNSTTCTFGIGTSQRSLNLGYKSLSAVGDYYIDFVASGTPLYGIAYNNNVAGAISTWDNIAVYPINNDGSVDISGATAITESRNYLDAIVYADVGGQPTYVEQLPKTQYVDAMQVDTLKVLSGFDLGQKWYDVTASRVFGTTYTNSTGKPILVFLLSNANTNGYAITINGVLIDWSASSTTTRSSASFIVPNGATYSQNIAVYRWFELR